MHEIIIKCSGGAMEVAVRGIKGPSCLQVTKELEADGEVKTRKTTGEYKEAEISRQMQKGVRQ